MKPALLLVVPEWLGDLTLGLATASGQDADVAAERSETRCQWASRQFTFPSNCSGISSSSR